MPEQISLDKLKNLIDESIGTKKVTSSFICHSLGISRSQLHRFLKKETSLSLSLYIRERKLLKAQELLLTTNLQISEIAFQVGIDSPQSFSKYFTEKFGENPSVYRKANPSPDEQDVNVEEQDFAEIPNNNRSKKISELLTARKSLLILFTAICSIVLAVVTYQWWQNKQASNTIAADNSLVILPFSSDGLQGDSLTTFGIMEQVHKATASNQNLRVVSRSSAGSFEGSTLLPSEIAQQLGVRYVLLGKLEQKGSSLYLSVELVEGVGNRIVWEKEYPSAKKNIVTFINDVSNDISNQINKKLHTPNPKITNSPPTLNLQAYNEYLQGEQLLSTRAKDKLKASILKFDRAIALDPGFSQAYSSKAEAYLHLGGLGYLDLAENFKLAEENLFKALKHNPENGRAYGILANIYNKQYKWEQANTTYQLALRYSPNDALINYWYSLLLRSVGKVDAATAYSLKAVGLDPLIPVIQAGHIINCSYSKNEELLQAAVRRGELMFDDSFLYYWSRAYVCLNTQDYRGALQFFEKGRQLNPTQNALEIGIVFSKGRLGNKVAVNKYLDSLTQHGNNPGFEAIAYAGLSDKNSTLRQLETMADQGRIPADFKVSPYFAFLHGDPRFDAILKRFNLDEITVDLVK